MPQKVIEPNTVSPNWVLAAGKKVTAEAQRAIEALRDRLVPPGVIQERPGTGTKFSYVSHIWTTKMLQDALPFMWSFEALDWQIYKETLQLKSKTRDIVSVAARCRLTIYIQVPEYLRTRDGDPLFVERYITEVGAVEKNSAMPTAMSISSAVSRALVRCVMRSLGVGIELYNDEGEEVVSPTAAWNLLKRHAIYYGVSWDETVEKDYRKALDDNGISSENLVDEFDLAIELLKPFIPTDFGIKTP